MSISKCIKSELEYLDKKYPTVELFDFVTSDGYNIDYAVFVSEDFEEQPYDNELLFRLIDEKVYAYLPKELIVTGTEEEIRAYIKENIG